MSPISLESLARYWSPQEVAINVIILFNLAGALLLGLLVGYERSYHGRAAGMRTYGLVCMASCAITVVTGYPEYWYAGAGNLFGHLPPDPTRVIQGIVTGIGFLGAGVIMKEGLNISGLTTAASIWAASAIGVLVGLGFYAAAILLALLSAALMMWAARLEQWLPSRPAIAMMLRFRPGFSPNEEVLKREARLRGYEIAPGSFRIQFTDGRQEWRYIAIALDKNNVTSISRLSEELTHFDGVDEFELSHARN
ncbi:magnesium transporter MgtC [Denitratisoma sp. DHT3]|uniref:MgtC/SapB family protein n=1 Tax=Denitratisoma sp. DHT3 TaxID=1981880 RepID=UPI0011987265|nr:MgtC/SapB family protein [Denitratisoma sp. DHT3]QDX82902.1 magnesium transporter MgtC [Denitratisoma sp. DHT3]